MPALPSLLEDGVHPYLFVYVTGKIFPDLTALSGIQTRSGVLPGEKRVFQSVMNTAADRTVVQSPVLSPWADWVVLVVLMIFPLAL
jgi:hypothetical protein